MSTSGGQTPIGLSWIYKCTLSDIPIWREWRECYVGPLVSADVGYKPNFEIQYIVF